MTKQGFAPLEALTVGTQGHTSPEQFGKVMALAVDYMVFNVTKDDIRIRMSAVDEEIWPPPALKEKMAPDFTQAIPFSEFTKSGAVGFPEVVGPIHEEIIGIYGTDYKPAFK